MTVFRRDFQNEVRLLVLVFSIAVDQATISQGADATPRAEKLREWRRDREIAGSHDNADDISESLCDIQIQSPMQVYYEWENLQGLMATASCKFGTPAQATARVAVNGEVVGTEVPVRRGELFLAKFTSLLQEGPASIVGQANVTIEMFGSLLGDSTITLLGHAVAHFTVGYSELGMDLVAIKLAQHSLAGKESEGFFFEIGAFNGWKYSNSLQMEIAGWHGICVEPFPNARTFQWRKAQNFAGRHVLVQAAALGEERDVEFVATAGGEHRMSGGVVDFLQEPLESSMTPGGQFPGELFSLTARTPASILSEHLLDPHQACTIHFLSVDTEGSEADILATFPFRLYTVCSATVEHNGNPPKQVAVRGIMREAGFTMSSFVERNRDDFFFHPACQPPYRPPPPCRLKE